MTKPLICQLPDRGVVRISGDDRRKFLQGLISNDIALCQPGKPIYAALLTPQGKFLHDMFVIDNGDDFLIDCEVARADDLLKRLRAHKLRAKVTFENANDAFAVWVSWNGDTPKDFYIDPRLPPLGSRAVFQKDFIPEGAVTPFDVYDKHRLSLGVPDGSRDLVIEKSTLVEGNLDLLNAISWTKGCYMGQELTARMHYRGLAKKRMFPVGIEGTVPMPGSVITINGEDVGEMRSSYGDVGLALLNIDKAQSGGVFMCGDAKLSATKPDWLKL